MMKEVVSRYSSDAKGQFAAVSVMFDSNHAGEFNRVRKQDGGPYTFAQYGQATDHGTDRTYRVNVYEMPDGSLDVVLYLDGRAVPEAHKRNVRDVVTKAYRDTFRVAAAKVQAPAASPVADLERLNAEIASDAAAGVGAKSYDGAAYFAAYDAEMARRAAEVRAAIETARNAACRSFSRHFVDGIEGALIRAIETPRQAPAAEAVAAESADAGTPYAEIEACAESILSDLGESFRAEGARVLWDVAAHMGRWHWPHLRVAYAHHAASHCGWAIWDCEAQLRRLRRLDRRAIWESRADELRALKAEFERIHRAAWLKIQPAETPDESSGKSGRTVACARIDSFVIRSEPLIPPQAALDEIENWEAKAARRARVPAAAPSVGRVALLSVRCMVAARSSPMECVRIVSLAALAAVSMREESKASRMWLGQLRGAFRRAMAVRAAAEAAIQPTPWLDLLGSHALTSAAVLGVVAAVVTYLTVR